MRKEPITLKKKAFQRPFESTEIGAHMMMTSAGTNDKLVE